MEKAEKKIIMLDGAAGTSLWEKASEKVPVWRYNVENPKIVRELNEEYVDAGADIIMANTFAANGAEVARSSSYSVGQVVSAGVKIAQDAADGRVRVGLAIGPLTGLLKPYGKISREEAKAMYEEQIGAGMQEKPDMIWMLTFMDLEMMKIAAEIASGYGVPVCCSMSFMGANKNGVRPKTARTMMGNTPKDIVEGLRPYNVAAVGLNCSLGPVDALPVIADFKAVTDLPVIFKPNAGTPIANDDGSFDASFDIETFAGDVLPAVDMGAAYIGGCCGTNPAYIRRLAEKIKQKLEAEA
ncbi:homocysteine S-methyltransferase family protein [Cloacibacillus sp. An23]|uniref:homocysteine S-methyltransferase family protein n=1 Tax=Cloacibacillus sp. An23 TaxID=1965591 RepID=UPI000B387351|nr:homocysteine S-methyltransferase family protein [Cloacibacillus sp. An23]OUO91344.1 hypothetical protein B5F39_12940 [Cloacibacillus sp. An23]